MFQRLHQPLCYIVIGVSCLFSALSDASTQYLSADAYIDVENGVRVENPLVTIEAGQITKVSTDSQPPPNANVIKLSGYTLLPGLMDMHVHLTGNADDHGYKSLAISLPRATINGVNNARKTVMAGFTTVRNVGADGYADVALKDAIDAGDIVGPRLFVAGHSIGVTGGHCDNNLLPSDYAATGGGVADGPWAVRAKVRENIKYGANVTKICATGGVLSKGTKVGVQQLTLAEMQAIVEESHMRGLTVAAHAHGTEGIYNAIKAGVDSVEHVSFLNDESIELAKQNGTVFSMDIYVTEYILGEGEKAGILEESLAKERTVGKRQRENFRKAVEAGVKMVFGTDAGVYPHGDNAMQFARMVQFGMTPMQAIQAATINAAALLNQSETLGSISAGKHADIIAVKGDPLSDISLLESVGFVMQSGKILKHSDSPDQ
ncbi:Xaa-Pro dipeptidase [Alteromonas oceanisediminis]|uniref:Xaa-Pro dipeptidase n=1 Tax=Alteromonas oceanisediminis TaxID=2836180 RepID=UPI001BD929AA|nr:amidohydrolase family protein [Alteromonas oceanisediminis]MBT0588092.1 amidohydrolase family protein [Alteromonas oceanisediminis]